MSAFIVDQDTIDYILSHLNINEDLFPSYLSLAFAGLTSVRNKILTRNKKLSVIKEFLFYENIRSVHHCYDGRPLFDYTEKARPFRRFRNTELFQALKSLDCLEYQSCECPDFKDTIAYKLINFLRKNLIMQDKRYEEAEWN